MQGGSRGNFENSYGVGVEMKSGVVGRTRDSDQGEEKERRLKRTYI
jgi:hypothetical protein